MREDFDLTNPQELRNFLKKHRVWTQKSLGQHFLINREALEKIVALGEIVEGERIVEIGPGHGVLTRELLKSGATVDAVEIDETIIPALKNATFPWKPQLEIFHQHVLGFVPPAEKYKCIANIPYQLTSPILRKFLVDSGHKPTKMVLLMQKEVAERIACKEGKDSLLSTLVKTYGDPRIAFFVPATSFFPPPKVFSAVLVIDVFATPKSSIPPKMYFEMLINGFKEPRKKLKNVLMKQFLKTEAEILKIFDTLEIGHDVRAQNLTIPQWDSLAHIFYQEMMPS
ncbi:MAG: 16S rRNA (adenine(1518)-N(6)/adenine(1519)-N(6))-dimethyltransferase RsmA [Candidatus Peregrinibacteria bacterium]